MLDVDVSIFLNLSTITMKNSVAPITPLLETESTVVQNETEREVAPYFIDLEKLNQADLNNLRQTGLLGPDNTDVQLLREKHIEYLSQVWKRPLKAGFVTLDASRPWMLYWCLHGCDLLDGMSKIDEETRFRMISTLEQCWTPISIKDPPVTKEEDPQYYVGVDSDAFVLGGFGGGPLQMAHAATTYASVLSLCILATDAAGSESSSRAIKLLEKVRIPLYRWMLSLQTEEGGYRMHHDGEVDVRASYTVLCCADLLQLNTEKLRPEKVATYIQNCQSFEGGISAEANCEAHGGYVFCGVAALFLLKRLDLLDISALTGWLARRQMSYEGGFSGRANKLVDGCYSFWQGGANAITSSFYATSDHKNDPWLERQGDEALNFSLLFDAPMLERYILLCAQDINGGLRDKPSKPRDFYHSCYNLSGLSVAQHCEIGGELYGDAEQSQVARTHPCYNIRIDRVREMLLLSW